MSADVLLTRDFDGVRLLTLNRPEAHNALGTSLVRELYAALLSADSDPNVRAIVITGSDPAFCAGIDLKEVATAGPDYLKVFEEANCISLVGQLATPVIGAVNGATFTGGLELALACDFLVASECAVFADTHARVGILPGGGLTARLPTLVGYAWARRMSMTGELVGAALALRIGLVTEVVPHDELLGRALYIASQIGDVDPPTVRALKHVYALGWEATVGPALAIETRLSRAERPAWDQLETNRQAVLDHNRSQRM